MLIDTHAHLNLPDYHKDLSLVIKKALKAGVKKIICVSSNIQESKKAIFLAKKYPKIIFPAVGIHPQQTDPENTLSLNEQLAILSQLAKEKEVVAIGECGLDFSPPPPPEKERSKNEQFFLFQGQIKIALETKKPILIHSREAFLETVSFLKKFKNLKGIFHCYSGGKKGIKMVEDLGFYFGVAGNLTYDEGLQNVFQQIPLEKIVLETDCPFLAPLPFRGQRNEPAYLKITAQKLAKTKNISFKIIAKVTTDNAEKVFSFPQS
ncbi:MAG: TatD family hydrolase [Microgenomates group bacterium]